ncbi:Chitin synthase, class 3 [Coelomomyces lativittatus]|nr:Chitin synthase, class 3 [Coelomomyces lativittatus]KAJ1511076.1 Chitin synthase, class 3 [Coelomomyces lativittatus]KAJ1517534.1 Chitin synthase, class 3 [Coelomomyces lativittatus]
MTLHPPPPQPLLLPSTTPSNSPFPPSQRRRYSVTSLVPPISQPPSLSLLSSTSHSIFSKENGDASKPPSLPSAYPKEPSKLRKKKTSTHPPYTLRPSTCRKLWVFFAHCITFYAFPPCLRFFGMPHKETQLAWREKMALCTLIFMSMVFLGCVTFAFNTWLCPYNDQSIHAQYLPSGYVVLNGYALNVEKYPHPTAQYGPFPFRSLSTHQLSFLERDVSFFFQPRYDQLPSCQSFFGKKYLSGKEHLFPCTFLHSAPTSKNGTLFPSKLKSRNLTHVLNLGNYPTEFCHPSTLTSKALNTSTTPPPPPPPPPPPLNSTTASASAWTRPSSSSPSSLGLVPYLLRWFRQENALKTLYFTWPWIVHQPYLIVYNGQVIDVSRLNYLQRPVNFSSLLPNLHLPSLFQQYQGKDMTHVFQSHPQLTHLGTCLQHIASLGSVDGSSVGCMIAHVILYVSLIAILALVLIRFFMAWLYTWCMAGRLGRKMTVLEKQNYVMEKRNGGLLELRKGDDWHAASSAGGGGGGGGPHLGPALSSSTWRRTANTPSKASSSSIMVHPGGFMSHPSTLPCSSLNLTPTSMLTPSFSRTKSFVVPSLPLPPSLPFDFSSSSTSSPSSNLSSTRPLLNSSTSTSASSCSKVARVEPMYAILLVTCYSEGEEALRTTLTSMADLEFLDTHKLMIVIADGIVTGMGNAKSTPELVLNMMDMTSTCHLPVHAYSYLAIPSMNMAKIYAGYYVTQHHRVPMLCVIKCGTLEEQHSHVAKPGNRGKRDSQLLVMSFFQKLILDERLSALDMDFIHKIMYITHVPPTVYEIILMVDADTQVHPEALDRMVSCFSQDSSIMGICGETQIQNKYQSWVTAIQVFEYYISHHLSKSFESVFGGVTCLPGCFSAFRMKVLKTHQHWVPLLINPEILQTYSEQCVDTLHKKNLYLLGEDRYLTTLMLKTFPKRKMIFLPQAKCLTVVPDTFRVLLSQRRRWINSTVHNLMELVLIRDLCGIFCISMQFVIFMELIGTLVLPAAISFTLYLLISSFFVTPIPWIPLALLALILGLPGLLIVLTSGRLSLLLWMMIYLMSLPIWNFVLPLYAFWHFDDFSWGATRPTTSNPEEATPEVEGVGEEKEEEEEKKTKGMKENDQEIASSCMKFDASSSTCFTTQPMKPKEGQKLDFSSAAACLSSSSSSTIVMKRFHEWEQWYRGYQSLPSATWNGHDLNIPKLALTAPSPVFTP